jgi:hypothetical protein
LFAFKGPSEEVTDIRDEVMKVDIILDLKVETFAVEIVQVADVFDNTVHDQAYHLLESVHESSDGLMIVSMIVLSQISY